jgi:hypothetical protein
LAAVVAAIAIMRQSPFNTISEMKANSMHQIRSSLIGGLNANAIIKGTVILNPSSLSVMGIWQQQQQPEQFIYPQLCIQYNLV